MRHAAAIRLTAVVLLSALAAPVTAQRYSGDAREACRRAASVLVNQEARWDDSYSRERSAGNDLRWRAADGTRGTCEVDSRGRVYGVRVERWGSSYGDIDVWPGSGYGESYRTLRCESDRGRRQECAIPREARVRLAERLSDTACIQGRNWGYSRSHIWVDDGCRAIFEVRW